MGIRQNPIERESALWHCYRLERQAGASPIEATERMGDFAKRLDALEAEYQRDLDIIRQCIGRVS